MKRSISKLASQASALLLFFSLLHVWPVIYYILLRYLVGVTAVLLIVKADEMKKQRWTLDWSGYSLQSHCAVVSSCHNTGSYEFDLWPAVCLVSQNFSSLKCNFVCRRGSVVRVQC